VLSRESARAEWQFYRDEIGLNLRGYFPHLGIFPTVELSSNKAPDLASCASDLSRERVSLGYLCFHVAQQKLDGDALLNAGIERDRGVAKLGVSVNLPGFKIGLRSFELRLFGRQLGERLLEIREEFRNCHIKKGAATGKWS
jgi:hypothetical protein